MSSFFDKFATQANRARQYTEEKLGHAEKTELDPDLQSLINRSEQMKGFTEQVKDGTEAVIQPNPKIRAEDYVMGKLDSTRMVERVTNEEDLGQKMIDAGNQVGPHTSYGGSLIKTGETFIRLGQVQKQYAQSTNFKFLQPIHSFLDGDVSAMGKAKQELETKRLDLDVAKTKLRKVKEKSKGENDPDVVKAEKDLEIAQDAFDKQTGVLKPMLEDILRSQDYHATLLSTYADTLKEYFDSCADHSKQLQGELKSLSK